MAELTCAMCGKTFVSRYSGAKYCGSKCKVKARKIQCFEARLRYNARNQPSAEVKRDRLSKDAYEANERGMSYGQYAAWKHTQR